MFICNESIQNLSSSVSDVWEIYNSVNQPNIALPGKSPEPTWAYVIAVKKNKKMQIYIYLFREQSKEGVFYTYEKGELDLVDAKAVFDEALDFTGSMGFIMEKVELADAPETRKEAIKSMPAFLSDLKTYKSAQESDELLLDAVYEDGEHSETESQDKYLNNKGDKQWFAKILSLF